MIKISFTVLFLFLLMQILNFKTYDDMPMGDMPTVDQETYTKQIAIPETPEKVKAVHPAIGLTTEEEEAGLSRNWGNQVGSWDKASILPTDNEKLIARHILYRQKIQTRVAVARRHSSRPWRRTGRDRQRNSNASPAGLLNSRRRPTSEHLLFGRRPR